MEENKKLIQLKKAFGFIASFLLSGVIAGIGSFFYGHEITEIICNVIMIMLGTGCVLFALSSSEVYGLYFYKYQGSYEKFLLCFLLSLTAGIFYPLLPVAGWPFLVVFVLLSLFSNSISGLAAGSVCLMMTVILENGGYHEFMLYFFSGLIGILVFSRLDESFKIGLPTFISLLGLFLCLVTNVVLFEQERLSLSQFTIILINMMVTFILLFIILKFFSFSVVHKYRERYMELNDPECQLLVELKEKDKQEYYRAIHTAYLAEKIAKRLELPSAPVKACGYYHRIGILKGENTWENVSEICNEYRFPPEVRKLLKEYLDMAEDIESAETCIILFADYIVYSIIYLYAKDPKAELDYDHIIDTVFRTRLEDGGLHKNRITYAQLLEMIKIFREEKLYYDFLR